MNKRMTKKRVWEEVEEECKNRNIDLSKVFHEIIPSIKGEDGLIDMLLKISWSQLPLSQYTAEVMITIERYVEMAKEAGRTDSGITKRSKRKYKVEHRVELIIGKDFIQEDNEEGQPFEMWEEGFHDQMNEWMENNIDLSHVPNSEVIWDDQPRLYDLGEVGNTDN